jgi:hypothetical protein
MIEIIKEKPLKSTTRVEGLLVRVTGGEWYAITKYQPSRNPWFGRAVKSTSTGRIDFNSNAIFVKRYARAPELEELKTILVDVLNGAEAPQDKPSF